MTTLKYKTPDCEKCGSAMDICFIFQEGTKYSFYACPNQCTHTLLPEQKPTLSKKIDVKSKVSDKDLLETK